MENTHNQTAPLPEKRKINFWMITTIVVGIFVLLLFSAGILFRSPFQTANIQSEELTPTIIEPSVDAEEIDQKNTLDFFISDPINDFPVFKSEVKPESIKRVFPVAIKQEPLTQKQSWLIEYEKDPGVLAYYLLSPTFEKELIDVKSCVSQDENPPIELEDIQTNNTRDGFIIFSGNTNSCYGGGGSGFVSVYNSLTGTKIPLVGEFMQPGTNWKGVSQTGNALGILRGIYGFSNPTVVVEYGDFAGNERKFGERGVIAAFDLQTGKLNQLVEFE